MENETTFAVDEQEEQDRERRLWGDGTLNASSPRHAPDNNLHSTVMEIQQVQMQHQSNLVRELQDRLNAKELENAKLKSVKRKAEEDKEQLSVPKKLRFTEDEDDAWTNIN